MSQAEAGSVHGRVVATLDVAPTVLSAIASCCSLGLSGVSDDKKLSNETPVQGDKLT